jgi:Putative transposase
LLGHEKLETTARYTQVPFGGPEAVLAYLSRYTHRVAISNRRLIAADAAKVSFKSRTIASTVPRSQGHDARHT